MATDEKNTQFHEYDSSILLLIVVPSYPTAVFDVTSLSCTVKEVPGLTWFLRASRTNMTNIDPTSPDYLRNTTPTVDLTLTLTPSHGITPLNLSYSVRGTFSSHHIVTEGFKPLPSIQTSRKLMFTNLDASAQTQTYTTQYHYGLESILAQTRGNLSFTVNLIIRSPKYIYSDVNIANLLRDIGSPKLSDFTIRVGGFEFKSHKHILSARSPVFCAMLATDCAEVKNSEMTMVDATKNAFEMFLKFLYTGSMPILELSLYMEVLILADKYQVMDLKWMCESKISSKMTIQDPVHEIYQLAFTYNCSHWFQTNCFDFVKKRFFSNKYICKEMMNEPEKILKLVNIAMELDDTLRDFNNSALIPSAKRYKGLHLGSNNC